VAVEEKGERRRKEKSREKKGFVKININLIEGLNLKWLKV
jgi:hypothetical protein